MSAAHAFSQPKYRPHIDGLRAVAVLTVVGFHAFPYWIKGGFVGVDVFFVISGFLISTILFENLAAGTFSFRTFYARRVRRIFPALALVLSACLVAGWFSLLADEYEQLGKHAAAGAAFVSNLALWSESGYFDNAAETKPLLHLWSLGIEEQFYLAWPLLVWLAWKRRLVLPLLAGLALASFALNIRGIGQDPVRTFYLPFTRFWELLAGALLAWWAFAAPKTFEALDRGRADAVALAGMGCLATSVLLTSSTSAFPGWWALLPVVGAGLVIFAGDKSRVNRMLLANRVAVWIGLISYPLYLWHWPLLAFARIAESDVPSRRVRILLVLVAFLAAWLTYRFVETPLRHGTRASRTTALLSGSMVLIGWAGLSALWCNGFTERRIASIGAQFAEAKADWTYKSSTLASGRISDVTVLRGVTDDAVLFVGSSLMGQYYPRAAHLYGQAGALPRYTTVFASRNTCTPLPDFDTTTLPENVSCTVYYHAAMELAREPRFVKIVLAGLWPNLAPAGELLDPARQLAADVAALRKMGKHVYLISNPPQAPEFSPDRIFRQIAWSTPSRESEDLFVGRAAIEDKAVLQSLQTLCTIGGCRVVDPFDYLCPQDRCYYHVGGKPLYNDPRHIRAQFAAQQAIFVDELVSAPTEPMDGRSGERLLKPVDAGGSP
jgi:peptidoglycan/LPS O-acetylase OafA/YrhL